MESYLPPAMLARLDLSTLKLEHESFVDAELRKHFSDLLFSVKTTDQDAVFIYLLLEHKSAPEPWVAFQLLRYIVKFWERQHEQGCERLPLVIPIVFYHGHERWNVARNLSALIAPTDLGALAKYAVDFEYDLRDISLRTGEEIKGKTKLRVGLELLRFIFSDVLEQRLPEIFRPLRELSRADAIEFMRPVLAYLSAARKKLNREKVREAMENVFPPMEFNKEAVFIQEWMEEGKHDGVSALTLRLLQRRFGALDEATELQIRALPNQKLEDLGVEQADFAAPADLQKWLADNTAVN